MLKNQILNTLAQSVSLGIGPVLKKAFSPMPLKNKQTNNNNPVYHFSRRVNLGEWPLKVRQTKLACKSQLCAEHQTS